MVPARVYLLLFATCFTAYALITHGGFNPNSFSRFALTMSLVRSNTVTIDEFAEFAGDKSSANGHFYSDKAPGMSLLALLPTMAIVETIEAAGGETNVLVTRIEDGVLAPAVGPRFHLYIWFAAIAASALLCAAAVVFLFDALLRLKVSSSAALGFAAVFGLGTLQWGWATTFFSHATTGALLVTAFWALLVATDRTTAARLRMLVSAGAGAVLGMAVVVEFTAIVPVAFLTVFGLYRGWPLGLPTIARSMLVALAAASIPLFTLAAYNAIAFGSPFALGYGSVVGFEGMQTGIFGVNVPDVTAIRELLFGYDKGLFWYAPLIVLFPVAIVLAFRGWPDVVVLATVVVVAYLLITAGYVYWAGGYATGPRHIIPSLAFIVLPIALAYGDRPIWQKAIVIALAVPGFVTAYMTATTDMYTAYDFEGIAIFAYTLPVFFSGDMITIVFHELVGGPLVAQLLYFALVAGLGAATWFALPRSPPATNSEPASELTGTPIPGTT